VLPSRIKLTSLATKHQIIVNTIKEPGAHHILVNNAGVMLDWTTTVFDIGLDTLTQTLHTNLYGAFQLYSALYSIDEGIRLLLSRSFLSSTSFWQHNPKSIDYLTVAACQGTKYQVQQEPW